MFKNIGRAQRGAVGMGLGGAPAPVRGRGSAFRGRGGPPGRGMMRGAMPRGGFRG